MRTESQTAVCGPTEDWAYNTAGKACVEAAQAKTDTLLGEVADKVEPLSPLRRPTRVLL